MDGLFAKLQGEFSKSPCNYEIVGQLLTEITVEFSKFGLLGGMVIFESVPLDQLLVIREVLEMGVFWSVYTSNGPAFELYLAQLLSFYFEIDEKSPLKAAPASPRMPCILGLNLMYLLSANRRADFHIFLEKIPKTLLTSSPHLQFPLQLEQCLTEGTYNRVLLARSQVPAPEFGWFVDSLMEAIRKDIADCMEKSCEQMASVEVLKMLLFDPAKDSGLLDGIVASRNWSLRGNIVYFSLNSKLSAASANVDPLLVIKNSLQNAHELEQFV